MRAFESIVDIVKQAGYCKRDLPSLNQIKLYLKKEKNVSKDVLGTLTETNIAEKFAELNEAS